MNILTMAGIEWKVQDDVYFAKIAGVQLRMQVTKGTCWIVSLGQHTSEGWAGAGNGYGDSKDEALNKAAEVAKLLFEIPGISDNPWRNDVTGDKDEYYARLDGKRTLRIDSYAFIHPSYCVTLAILGDSGWERLRKISYRDQNKSSDATTESRQAQALAEMIQYAAMLYPGRLSAIADKFKFTTWPPVES